MNKVKEKLPIILFSIIAFVCLYVFYTVSHPLYIYDIDDWTYISFSRRALPQTSQWNPTKVLPETLMPLVAELGVRFVMPLTGSYIDAMAGSFAVVVSACIIAYLLLYGKVIKDKFLLNNMQVALFLVMLTLLHFLPFRVSDTNNYHLFYGGNVNCYFNYLIPALVNASVVMYLMVQEKMDWKNPDQRLRGGILILLLYLCINSNLLHSGILMAYIGMRLIGGFAEEVKKGNVTKQGFISVFGKFIKHNLFEILIAVCWLAAAMMEMQGGRAHMGDKTEFLLKDSVRCFVQSISNMNRLFLISTVAVILLAFMILFVSIREREALDKTYIDMMKKLTLCIGLEVIYLIVLCARVSPAYITKPNVMISWMFYLLLMEIISCAYILKKCPVVAFGVPLLVYVLIFETVIDGKTYVENWVPDYSAETVKALDENIIRQVKEAEAAGAVSVDVLIPKTESEEWPMAVSYGGYRISTTLYLHGFTHRRMDIRLVPDESVNEEFHLYQ